MPGRKKKCPGCGNDIFVRTRPQDKAKILVRSDQLLAIEEQWSIINGTHEQFLAAQRRRQAIAAKLRKRLGREPSENEIEMAILNEDAVASARQQDWGFFRNAKFSMAEILRKEKKFDGALDLLLEVCYLDVNGPSNCGGETDKQLLREFPPFDPKMGMIAPGIVSRLEKVAKSLSLSIEDIRTRFLAIANALAQRITLPVPPDKAWRKLKREIELD